MIEFDIHLPNGWFVAEKISEELNNTFGNTNEDIQLQSHASDDQFRMADVALLVALVSAGGAALGAFVSGLFSIIQTGVAQRIVIQKGDLKVEIPANAKKADLDKAVETLRQLEGQKLELHID